VRTIENLEEKGAERAQRIYTLESQIQAMKERISALSTEVNTTGSQVQTAESQITSLTTRSISRCRVCFRETTGNNYCWHSRNTCSGWSNSPSWTSSFTHYSSSSTNSYCTYQWRLECEWKIRDVVEDGDQPLSSVTFLLAKHVLPCACSKMQLLAFSNINIV